MEQRTLRTIRRFSLALGLVAAGLFLLIGLRVAGLAIDYGWDVAIETVLAGAIREPEHF